MRALADAVVRLIARTAMHGWFRGVEVAGLERLTPGPTVVVANHNAGFVDPSLLVAVLPRVPRFLAVATLWRVWPIRPLLALAGAIPVHRAQDGATGRNTDAFAAARGRLAAGGLLALFPEGESSDASHLLPLKTGVARIALGAAAAGTPGIRIVPVGLIYEQKQTARARAYVRVGEPIDVDGWLAAEGAVASEDDRALVNRLIDDLEERLAAVTLDFEDAAEADDLTYAARVSLRRQGGSPTWSPTLAETDRVARALADAPPPATAEVRRAVASYRDALATNQVSDRQVAAGPRSAGRTARALGGVASLLAVPFAIVGLVVNVAPATVVWLAGRRPASPARLATIKFLTGLAAFPLTWLAWRYLAFDALDDPWLVTVLVGPLCGLAAAVLGYRLHLARLARLKPSRLVVVSQAAEDLVARRERLVAAVAVALAAPPVGGRGPHAAGSLGDRP
jgi:1-acyl-sn-glycerol-3-phosphate acyltransferase